MSKGLNKLQKSYDKFLTEVIKKSTLFNFNPTNLDKEKNKFIKNKKYAPQFEYDSLDTLSLMYKDILSSLTIHEKKGNPIINQVLIGKKTELLNKFELCTSVGTDKFTKNSIKVYGKPSASLIKKAKEILSEPSTTTKQSYVHSDEVILQLKKYFRQLSISGWKIKKVDLVTSANVNCEKRRLELKKRERMQQNYIDRLKVHEIGTHALRFENGRLQPLEILKYGLANYLSTEEGLAMYSEEISGVSSQEIKRNYAGRVLAVHYALQFGFDKTYKNLLKYFKPKVALKLTIRAKRGLADTSKPGGFTKDHVYLKGYLEVKNYAKKHSLKDLYIGKVGIKDLDNLKKTNLLIEPNFLPLYLQDKN